jgi:energy-coupling factor transport system permease protein
LPGSRWASASSGTVRPDEPADPSVADPGRAAGRLPAYVLRIPTGPYRALNPYTKFVIALSSALVAFGVRGWTGPLGVLALTAFIAIAAGVTRSLRRFVLGTVPIVASILVVNAFLYPGATDVLFTIGPFAATGTGVTVALQATLRVVAFALSVAVFSLTTATDDFLADLEHRGTGRRLTFVVGSAIRTIPAMGSRAVEIVEAQRARGLDTEGSIRRRLRGIVPLAGPMVFGALAEVEERTIALEARAFSAPVRRTVMRTLPDGTAQRALRWVVGLGSLAAVAASVAGRFPLP